MSDFQERLRNIPSGTWGFFCIVAGAAAHVFGPAPRNREGMLGGAIAELLLFAFGVVLMISCAATRHPLRCFRED